MIDDSLAFAGQNFLYLRQVSPKDAKWDAKKQQSQAMANLYDLTTFANYAAQIRFCSPVLAFRQVIAPDGSVQLKLHSNRSCRCRFCPSCQWRRSSVWMARSKKALPQVLEEKPKLKFVFLTLTVRNCPAGELRQTIEKMNAAWQRLSQRKTWPAVGFIKSIEVTRSAEGEAHPHIHAILAVNSSYFTHGYLSHEKWVKLWQDCLRVDYTPIVNIKVVKPPKNKPVTDYAEAVASSVAECIKYSVKPSDFNMSPPPSQLSNSEWLQVLTEQLHGTRAISVGGIIRKYMSEEEPEDLVHTGNAEEEEESDNVPVDEQVTFGWREELKKYALLANKTVLFSDLTTEKEQSPYKITFIKIPPNDPD